MQERLLLLLVVTALCGLWETETGWAQEFSRITDAVLENPSPNDWIAWRGTHQSQGYTPLKQINRDNVRNLQLAWGWAIEEGNSQPAPIVYDGVMYLSGPGGIVHALDGATGDLLWEYRHRVNGSVARVGSTPTATIRGLALYDDKVYLNAPDARVIALDVRSGTVVWDTQVADPADGFGFTAAPVIARGVVVSGLMGCRKFIDEKCALIGHDAQTGKRLWRVPTIPGGNDPGTESWGDLAPVYRSGTGMWIPGSYDHELNLVYWATSQAKPWARVSRGTDGDALYSNTTLAINPDTGEVVWYRQTIPGETHDLDEVYESVLIDRGSQRSLFKMGKIGILWELDRSTGEILHATDLGYQNLVDVDPNTGSLSYRPGVIPKLNEPINQCPGTLGFKNWPAMAYSPETDALYIPILMACAEQRYVPVEFVPGGGGLGAGGSKPFFHPDSDEKLGKLVAISTSGEVLWEHVQRAAFSTATLTTAGGLVFIADSDRYIRAHDVKTGEVLWQTRVQTGGQGFPMSYSAGGQQFVAIPVGVGAVLPGSQAVLLTPEVKRPNTGNALMVFALPDDRER
jgi:alcohol dehydrogenase (cytochrome c)